MRALGFRLIGTASFTGLLCGLGGPALAATPGATADDRGAGATISELVVTAEKREQNIQDVPEAISAYSAARRELIGINSIQDMTNFTPGLQYSTSTDRISLRGVGRLTNVLSADASVANYNDGIYETFAVAAGRSTLFLDRVEILRGPQGTLYGRNAIGGAINEISRRPSKTPYAEVRASYASYNHTNLEGAISGPLSETVGFRLGGQWEKQTKGWIHNIVPGLPDEGNVIDQRFVEGQIQVQFNDRLEMWTKVAGAQWRNGSGGPGAASGGWNPSPYSTDEGAFNPGYGCGANVTDVVNPNPLGCINPSATTPWREAKAETSRVTLPAYIAVASHWIWHGNGFDVRYLTGGVYYHIVLTGSTDEAPITQYTLPGAFGLPGLVVHPRTDFNYQELNGFWSHEINVLSTGAGPLQWLFGGYYFAQHYRQPVYASSPDEAAFDTVGGPEVFGGECGATGGVCAPVTGRRWFDNRPTVNARSAAIYGQVDWTLTATLKTTVGLRFSHDRKYGVEQVRLICYGLPDCYFFPEYASAFGGLPAVDITQNQTVVGTPNSLPHPKGVTTAITYDPATGMASRGFDASWQALTGNAGLEWTPGADTLVYGKYSRGYKSGGFYVGIFTVLAPHPWSDKETVDAFEVGLKRTFGRLLTLDAAAFHYSYKNLQIPTSLPNTTGNLGQASTIFFNVPKAVSQGFELETVWRPVGHLTILFSYGYLDAHSQSGALVDGTDPSALRPEATPIGSTAGCTNVRYGDAASTCVADVDTSPRPVVARCAFPAFGTPCLTPLSGVPDGGFARLQNLKGNQLPNAPRNKIALNATYTFRFEQGSLSPSISYVWRDAQYGGLFTRPYNRAPAWDQWDARLTWKSADGRTTVIAYGKNILNTIGYDSGASSYRRSGPVDNPPFDFPYTGAVSSIQGISSVYSVTPPRTWGVELQYRFF